jgi:hypothetical protein
MAQAVVSGVSYDCTDYIEPYDCGGHIGPLYERTEKPAWPMYSFDHAAEYVWNAIAANLNKRGWSDDEIRTWLQSKRTRWALEGELGDMLRAAATEFAEKFISDEEA